MTALLEIRNLAVEFATARGVFRAVDGLDLTLDNGAIVASSASPDPARASPCWR